LVQGYAAWCREFSAPNPHVWAADRLERLAERRPVVALDVVLAAVRALEPTDVDALHSLGAHALEHVLGDHFDLVWPTVSAEARELPQLAVALEDVILLPDRERADVVAAFLQEIGHTPAWREEDLPRPR
jgi:hypothetical protein